jgi:predicted transcriptional regulator
MHPGKVDVVAAILELCKDDFSKKALQKTGLASDMLNEQLALLESKHLIRILRDKQGKEESIKTTERGIKFLELYQSIMTRYLTTRT